MCKSDLEFCNLSVLIIFLNGNLNRHNDFELSHNLLMRYLQLSAVKSLKTYLYDWIREIKNPLAHANGLNK